MSKTLPPTPAKRSTSALSKTHTKTPSKSKPQSPAPVTTKTPNKKRKRPSQPEDNQEDEFSSLSEDETFQTAPSPYTSSPVKAHFPQLKSKKVRFDDFNDAAPLPIQDEELPLDDGDDEEESDSDAAPDAESTSQSALSAQSKLQTSLRAEQAQREEKRRRNRDVNDARTAQALERKSKSKPQPVPSTSKLSKPLDGEEDEGLDAAIARYTLPDGSLPDILPAELIAALERDEQEKLLNEIKAAQAAKRIENVRKGARKIVFKEEDRRDLLLGGKKVRVLRKEGVLPPRGTVGVDRVKRGWLEDRKGRGRVVKRVGGFAKR